LPIGNPIFFIFILYLKDNIAYNHTVIKKKERDMPTKTTKSVKKAPAKKPAKRVAKPATKPAVAAQPVATEMPAAPQCCHCTRRKKIIYLTVMFLLGVLVGQLFCCCGCDHHKRAPRVHFVNGCVDVTTVKCPKMLEQLPTMDANNDGCITRAELRAAKRAMRRAKHAEPAPVAEPEVNVEEAIAPAVED
jgi:hypothetical protein